VLGAAPLVVGGCLLMLVPRVDSSALQLALLVFGSGLCGAIYVVCPAMLGEFAPVSQRDAVISIMPRPVARSCMPFQQIGRVASRIRYRLNWEHYDWESLRAHNHPSLVTKRGRSICARADAPVERSRFRATAEDWRPA